MSRLLELKRAIMAAVKAVPEVKDVFGFAKLFEAEDIKQVSFRSPAAFVSVLAAPGSEALPDGDSRTKVEIVIALSAKGSLGVLPEDELLIAAEAVFKAARWAQWGMSRIWPVQNRRMEIMPVPGRTGVALLAVRFEQFIVLDDADPDDIDETLRPRDDQGNLLPVDLDVRDPA